MIKINIETYFEEELDEIDYVNRLILDSSRKSYREKFANHFEEYFDVILIKKMIL